MASRNVFHIAPHRSGGWMLVEEGAERAIAITITRAQAVARARALAEDADVVIHLQDGSIQPDPAHGSDPAPPR